MPKKPHSPKSQNPLIQLLYDAADASGVPREDWFPPNTGATYDYYRAISSGNRSWDGVSSKILRKIADALDLSYLHVQILAGMITPADVQMDRPSQLEKRINDALEAMHQDPVWQPVAPSWKEWDQLSPNARIGWAMMWHRTSLYELAMCATDQALAVAVHENSESDSAD